MANNKDFKVNSGIQPTVYLEGLGTVSTGTSTNTYDLAGATYTSGSYISPTDVGAIFMKPDGTKLYIAKWSGGPVHQYSITDGDITTLIKDNITTGTLNSGTVARGLWFKSDGTRMFIASDTASAERIDTYTLSTAWDLTSANYVHTISITGWTGTPYAFGMSDDGTKAYFVGHSENTLFQFNMTTAWDFSTTVSSAQITLPEGGTLRAMHFFDNGNKMWITGQNDVVYEWHFGTAWDVTTLTSSGISYNALNLDGLGDKNYYGMTVHPDGDKMYLCAVEGQIFEVAVGSTTHLSNLDLSTGSVFEYTPTTDTTIGVANAAASGTVSSATLLLSSEDTTGVSDSFNTTIASPSYGDRITTGLDLSTNGGMLWLKKRNDGYNFYFIDTVRGPGKYISSSSNIAEATDNDRIKQFYTDGFLLGSDAQSASGDMVYWSFPKKAGFFDIVTWTGNGGNNRSVSHNLGSAPGMMFIKRLDSASNWYVYHRSSYPNYLTLNTADAGVMGTGSYEVVSGTSVFYVGNAGELNANGGSYVAYLFAHDTSDDSVIKCGTYNGNGSTATDGNAVELGFEPQFVLIKNTSTSADWIMFDNKRGVADGSSTNDKYLFPNVATSEGGGIPIDFTSTGFNVGGSTSTRTNASGHKYVYMAIKDPYFPTVTYDSTFKWPGGTAPTATGPGQVDVINFSTDDGGTTVKANIAIDGAE